MVLGFIAINILDYSCIFPINLSGKDYFSTVDVIVGYPKT